MQCPPTAQSLKQTIISATGDSDESVRMTAVRYLGQIGSTEDLPRTASESDKRLFVAISPSHTTKWMVELKLHSERCPAIRQEKYRFPGGRL